MRHHFLAPLALLGALIAPARAVEINVYAAASVTHALKEIGAQYEKDSGVHVAFNFGASSLLVRQIEEGAPADLFLSADDAQMDRLAKADRLQPETRRALLSNTLVIIAPLESTLTLSGPAELPDKIERLALADPKIVPVGVYTRTYLTRLKLWERLEPKVVPVENVRAAAAAVESGNVDAGFVYKTDALISKKVKVIFSVPKSEAPEISYPVALLRAAPHRAAAEKFLLHLGAERATGVFQRFGFEIQR